MADGTKSASPCWSCTRAHSCHSSELCALGQQDTHYGEKSELLAVTQTSHLLEGSVFMNIMVAPGPSIVVDNNLTTATVKEVNWDMGTSYISPEDKPDRVVIHMWVYRKWKLAYSSMIIMLQPFDVPEDWSVYRSMYRKYVWNYCFWQDLRPNSQKENRCIVVEFVTNCCLPDEYFCL